MTDSSKDFVDPVKRTQELTKPKKISRFYDVVSVVEKNEKYQILLDGRNARTPAKSIIEFEKKILAEKVADEWRAQKKEIDPFSMPLSRLSNVALDIADATIPDLIRELSGFAGTDAIIFRSSEPEGLVKLQETHWDPIHQHAQKITGAHIILTQGLSIPEQNPLIVENIEKLLSKLSVFELTAMHTITTIAGSIYIALAHLNAYINAKEAWLSGHLEEDWNISLWGDDEEAVRRRDFRNREWQAASQVLEFYR